MTDVEVVVDAKCEVGEGPVWHAEERVLYWVDVNGFRIHRFDPASKDHTVAQFDQHICTVVPREQGGFALAVRDGFALTDGFGPPLRLIAPVEGGLNTRMNDGKVDPGGRFFAGTMGFDAAPEVGSLYRLDPDLTVERVVSEVTISNGIAWSSDSSTMYYIDTPTSGVDAFDYDLDTGALSNRRRAITFDIDKGLPDGMSIDDEGYLWIAFWGGSAVRRYSTDGNLDAEIKMPVSQPSSCAFGGEDLTDLYVTSARDGLTEEALRDQPEAGALFRARPGVRGTQSHFFGG